MRGSDAGGPDPLAAGMSPPDFAAHAAGVARALQDWHARHGPHEGVRPDAIRIDGGVALSAVRPNRDVAPAYAAPEESGRLSYAIDERTDLYSLGVMLYELLTGRPPGPGGERPGALVAGVPSAFDEIVLRLLEAAPQDRYQTARGVATDLDAWLRADDARARRLPLATDDIPDRLRPDARVNLRQPRLAGLQRAYERVAATGTAEVIAITGDAGLDKAALASAFADAVVRDGGRVLTAAGTADTVGAYPVLTALLSDLRAVVAGEQRSLPNAGGSAGEQRSDPDGGGSAGERRSADGAGGFVEAVGRHAVELGALVPQLGAILHGGGSRPPSPVRPVPGPVPGAGHRLALGVRRLLRAVAGADRPLVVVIRDLHRADEASVRVLARLLSDPADLPVMLLVTAAANDRLRTLLAGAQARNTSIKMRPLADSAVAEMLARTLGTGLPQAMNLARIIAARDGSNSLRIGQVLADLADRGHVTYDKPGPAWRWSLEQIEKAPWGAAIGELTARRLDRLPGPARRVLYAAALAGRRFDAETLGAILALPPGDPAGELATALRRAVAGQFVVRCADPAPERAAAHAYRWIHEDVRAAVLDHVPDGDRAALRLAVGRVLVAGPEPDRTELGIARLNASADRLTPDERARLIALNHAAGRRAASVDADDAAAGFFEAALELIDDAYDRGLDPCPNTAHAASLGAGREVGPCSDAAHAAHAASLGAGRADGPCSDAAHAAPRGADREFELCLDAAHTAQRRGDPEGAAALLERAAARIGDPAGDPVAAARLLAVRVVAHRAAGDRETADTTALRALALLDADPTAVAGAAASVAGEIAPGDGEEALVDAARRVGDRVRERLAGVRPAELAAAGAATDSAALVAAEILASVLSPERGRPRHELLAAAGVELTLDRGRHPASALAFACLAAGEARGGGDDETVRRYVRTAQRLLDAEPSARRAGAARAVVALALPAWFDPADAALAQLDAAHAAAEEEGDPPCAAAGRVLAATHRFALGIPLGEVAASVEEALAYAERCGLTGAAVAVGEHLAAAVARLRGQSTPDPAGEPPPDGHRIGASAPGGLRSGEAFPGDARSGAVCPGDEGSGAVRRGDEGSGAVRRGDEGSGAVRRGDESSGAVCRGDERSGAAFPGAPCPGESPPGGLCADGLLSGDRGYLSLAAITGPLTAAYLLGDRAAATALAAAGDRAARRAPATFLGADVGGIRALLRAEAGPSGAGRVAEEDEDTARAPSVFTVRAPSVFTVQALLVSAATEPTTDPATESTGKPASQSVTGATREPAAHPAAEPAGEPALDRFDRAIRAARQQGCLPLEALAAELGGRHALAVGRSSEAVAYLRRARDCYAHWGADAVAARIGETLAAEALPGTQAGPADRLELLTVLRTFQTITAELQLDRLVELLLRQFVEHSGAERGELHLFDGDRLHAAGAAYANIDGTRVTLEPVTAGAPADLIERVLRQRRTCVDESASRLCAPIVHGERVTGVLYLEHDRPAAFGRDRAELMEVLCAQAGIALDNAALHARLTRAGRVLDATFEQLPLGLILLGPDLTVLRASPLALTITGLPIVPGMPLIDLFNVLGPTDTAGTPLRFQPALAAEALTTQPIQREMIIVQPSGHRLGLSLTAAPLRDPADALVGVMLLLAEIPN